MSSAEGSFSRPKIAGNLVYINTMLCVYTVFETAHENGGDNPSILCAERENRIESTFDSIEYKLLYTA